MPGQRDLGWDERCNRSQSLAGVTQKGKIAPLKLKYHLDMCLYLTVPSMSKEIIGIKVLFNAMTDIVSLFRLQGQLGLGEDRIHISAPCLLSYSQLAEVTQIQAGDSYSAAITGEPHSSNLPWQHTQMLYLYPNCSIWALNPPYN